MNKLLIFTFLLLAGCAQNTIEKNSNMAMTVDWSKNEDRAIPKIESSLYGNQYGPSVIKDENQKNKNIKNNNTQQSVALVLGAGGYRCIGHISLLKEISTRESKSLLPNVIVGHGIASIIASYYAFGYNPDYIEWKFFGFIRKAKDLKIYSQEWLNLYDSELIGELKNKRIEDSELTLILAVYDSSNKQVKYLKRGNLREALLANVKLFKKASLAPAFPRSFIDKKLLGEIGVEQIIGIDLLSEGISWKKGSGRVNGLFEKAASQFIKNKNKLYGETSYLLKDYSLDDVSSISKIVFLSKKFSKDFVDMFENKNNIKGQKSDTSKN
jgi:hypothetical protein